MGAPRRDLCAVCQVSHIRDKALRANACLSINPSHRRGFSGAWPGAPRRYELRREFCLPRQCDEPGGDGSGQVVGLRFGGCYLEGDGRVGQDCQCDVLGRLNSMTQTNCMTQTVTSTPCAPDNGTTVATATYGAAGEMTGLTHR